MESGLQIIKGFSSSVYSSDYYFQLVGRCTTRTAKKLCGRRFVVDLPIPSWSRSCTHKLIEIRLIKSIDNFSCFCLRLQSAEHLHVLLWGLCDQWFPGNRTTVGRIEDHMWCRGLCWIWQLCLSEGINYQLIWHQDLGIYYLLAFATSRPHQWGSAPSPLACLPLARPFFFCTHYFPAPATRTISP